MPSAPSGERVRLRPTMRVVLDTNVVVSALVWGAIPFKLLQAATDGDIDLYTSHPYS